MASLTLACVEEKMRGARDGITPALTMGNIHQVPRNTPPMAVDAKCVLMATGALIQLTAVGNWMPEMKIGPMCTDKRRFCKLFLGVGSARCMADDAKIRLMAD